MLADFYLYSVEKSLGTMMDHIDPIRKAAECIINAVSNEKRVFVFDRYGILDSELVDRSSGLMLFRAYTFKPAPGDILLLASLQADHESDLTLLNEAHSRGAIVITISPEGKLSASADYALINRYDSTNGIVTLPDTTRKFCPMSGIINGMLAWTLTAEITASMIAAGTPPTVIWGDYFKGGEEHRSAAKKRFISLGY